MKMPSTSRVAAATNDSSTGEPTHQQQMILDAYFANPNAAAVARELRKSERNVRRIVERFADLLRERGRQQDAERHARAAARQAKFDDWLDHGLEGALRRLDALTTSENDSVALRAIRLMLDLAMRTTAPATVFSSEPGLDAMRQAKERELLEQLRALDADEATGTNGSGR
jgi:hypothetical protein